jgi:hypothetical protein
VLRGIESLMAANVDPAFKAVPPQSTAFLIWRIEVSGTTLYGFSEARGVNELKRTF